MNLSASSRLILKWLALLSLLLSSKISQALQEDRQMLAELSADSVDLNQLTHHGEYVGNVQFDQGTTHLRAISAITKGDKHNKLVFALAKGDKKEQAHYWAQPAVNKPELHAFADNIRYYPKRHLIEFIGNARIVQGNNSFAAAKISYNTLQQQIISKSDGKTRTTIIIHPEKKE